jgi:hypothetical protein
VHIDAIARLREELHARYHRVLELFAPDAPPVKSLPGDLRPSALEPLFRQLDKHLDAITLLTPRQGLLAAMARASRGRRRDDLLLDGDPTLARTPSAPTAPAGLADYPPVGPIQREIDAERARVVARRDEIIAAEGEAGWNRERGGETKRLYNLLETRHVLQLQQQLPDRQVIGQASLQIWTPEGRIDIPSGEGRTPDWAEIKDGKVQLGDLKSPSEVEASVAGGMKRNVDLEAEFKTTSTIGTQHANELRILERARQLGPDARVIIRGKDPSTGSTIEIGVSPDDVLPSRVTTYGQLHYQ